MSMLLLIHHAQDELNQRLLRLKEGINSNIGEKVIKSRAKSTLMALKVLEEALKAL